MSLLDSIIGNPIIIIAAAIGIVGVGIIVWMNKKDSNPFVKSSGGNIIAIALIGKLSVVTYLNAVAIATDNYGRFSNWGKDLFKLVFPEDYAQVYGASS